MSDTFWVTLPILITSVAGAILSIITQLKLRTVHNQINGKMAELLDATKIGSEAIGKAAGVEQERVRVPDTPRAIRATDKDIAPIATQPIVEAIHETTEAVKENTDVVKGVK